MAAATTSAEPAATAADPGGPSSQAGSADMRRRYRRALGTVGALCTVGPLCFQQVSDYRPPHWPGQEHPQQAHVDLWADDLDAAEARAVAAGARWHQVQPAPDS